MTTNAIIKRDAQAGVTLVEILVVLALLGIMTGAVALSVGGIGRGNSAVQEAELLVARLNRAADEVVLTAVPMRFRWSENSYQFEISQDGDIWLPHPISILAEDHQLPAGLRFSGDTTMNAVTVDANLIPDPRKLLSLRMSSDGGGITEVTFDGVNATLQEVGL